jgi:methionyl-tRNA formyltransferase
MKYIYFGSSVFSNTVINALYSQGALASLVVSQPDKPRGRGLKVVPTLVSEFAVAQEASLIKPESLKDPDFLLQIQNNESKFCFLADYGKILPKVLLEMPGKIFLCVHPSLLPAYRGPAPIQWALINGEKTIGVSIFKISPKIDSGEILNQGKIDIEPDDDVRILTERLAYLGGLMILETAEKIEAEGLKALAQDEAKASYYPKLTKDSGKILWEWDAWKIHNLVRATLGWPSSWVIFQGKLLKIIKTEVLNEQVSAVPSSIIRISHDGMDLATGKGVLRIKKVKPEGKTEMDAQAFCCGHRLKVGDMLDAGLQLA